MLVQVSSNGVSIDRFESSAKTAFTAFAVHADAVHNLTLTSNSNSFSHDCFILLEVRNRARPTPPMKIRVDVCFVRGEAYGFLRAPRSKRSNVETLPEIIVLLRYDHKSHA